MWFIVRGNRFEQQVIHAMDARDCTIHDQLKKKQKLEGRKKPACFK